MSASKYERFPHVELVINGKRVPLNCFVKKIIDSTVRGMLSSIKTDEDINDIKLTIKEDTV